MNQEQTKHGGHAIVPISVILVISAYIAAQMLADISSLKIGVVGGVAVDMGTFIYPVTFTLRDMVHKVLGKKNTRVLILAAGGINLLMSLYLMWTTIVPGSPDWGLDAQYQAILAPVWRIVIASIIAEVVSELVDTEAYQFFINRVSRRYQWARVLFSNSLSVPIDNLIFAFGAFAFTLPVSVVWEIFFFNLAVKFLVTLVSLPFIYLVPERHAPIE
ncbi:MAG: queuosine precursor transporter [Anaerolineales bacterium]|nr:queuosine precursor transporter [Anaerolineales bacterium]